MNKEAESLRQFYEEARRETILRAEAVPLDALVEMIEAQHSEPRSLVRSVTVEPVVAVIAEHKAKSPSEGVMNPRPNVFRAVRQYAEGGAFAISVLTQRESFGGSVQHLAEARLATNLPIVRKDYIDEEYQLYEARAKGADAVLLIAAALTDRQLAYLSEEARDLGLECLVEVHDEVDLERAMRLEPQLIGINNRDLETMEVDLATVRNLRDKVPAHIPVVAESGYSIHQPEHLGQLGDMRVDAVLIGTALMREPDPAKALRAWLDSGTSAA